MSQPATPPALSEEVVQFARSKLSGDLAQRDKAGIFSRDDWAACCEYGFLRSHIPKEYGGNELSVPETVRLFESLGYGCRDNGLTLGLSAQLWTVEQPLLQFGSEEQKQRYLPKLCAGQLLACDGVTEKVAGSDAASIETTAEKVDGGYRLNGRKTYITMAGHADLAIVIAKTDPAAGQWGLSAFFVEAKTPGFTQIAPHEKMGLRTLPFGDLLLEDCLIPDANRLGAEGAGVSLFHYTMDWERSFIQASHVGAMAYWLEECVEFARNRKQFGKSIGSFQSVTNRIADMRLRLESARLHLYKMAHIKEAGESAPLDAAMTNLLISEACAANAQEAIRIHGARGYLHEYGIERELRDAIGGLIYAGTSDIQRNIIARLLGLTP